MTKLAEQIGDYGEFVQIWGLQAPTGGTGNIVTTGMSGGDYTFIAAYSLYGVKQTYSVQTGAESQSSSYSSINITPNSANNWIVDAIEAEPEPSASGDNTQDWQEDGDPNSFDNGNGSSVIQTGGPTTVNMGWDLSYGARSNQVAVALEPEGNITNTTNYAYDLLRRILSASYPSDSYSYTYNAVGERLTSVLNGSSTSSTFNNDNQLTAFGSTSFTYDNKGNQTAAGSISRSFDFDNRLATQSASGNTYQFIYGGDGKRIAEKTNSSDSKQYINDVSGDLERVLIAKDLQNSTDNYYLYGAGIVSEGGVSAANRKYYLEDGLGNIRAVTDNSGDSVATYSYDAYGNLLDGSASDEFLYKGENLNPNTNLYYMRARYYDPTTGSFISRDPLDGYLKNPQSQNGYNFTNGNPINLSDPSGLWSVDLGASLGIAGASVTSGVVISDTGIFSYAGAGYGTPGPGISLMASPSSASSGISSQGGGGFIIGGNYSLDTNGNSSTSFGLTSLGFSAHAVKTVPVICF